MIDLGEALVLLSKRAHLGGEIIIIWSGVWRWV